jgi:hypothetical protein
LYGQNGQMLKFSTSEGCNHHNEAGAPKRYRFELEDGVELSEVWTPGQRNVVLEAVL